MVCCLNFKHLFFVYRAMWLKRGGFRFATRSPKPCPTATVTSGIRGHAASERKVA